MTIYDADFADELRAQTGVQDSVAVNQEAISQEVPQEQPLEQAVNQSVDAGKPMEQTTVSDKDYNWKALREEMAQIKADRDRLEQQFEDVKRSQYVQRQPEPPRKRAIDEIENNDLVTGAQFKQAMAEREAEYQLMLGELQVKAQHSDYDEVTAKYGVPLIEKEPDLAQGFLAAPNKAAYLYKLGKMSQMADQRVQTPEPVQQAPQASNNAQRIVENARKPGTLSNAVGGAGNLSKADYYASMSDLEFNRLVAKNMEEI